jgi:hypothetical protein
MKELLKGFWGYFGIIVLAAVFTLIGALLGKTGAGWVLFCLGVLSALAFVILGFVKNQFFQTGLTWQSVVLLAITSLLLVFSAIRMFTTSTLPSAGTAPTPMMQVGTPPSDLPAPEAATATATLAPTATATEVAPTATATAVVASSFTVCLNENTNVGYNIRIAPKDDAAFGGKIPMGACFVLDGRSSAYPGWYKLAPGQNGSNGISIGVDDSTVQLWVKGTYVEAFSHDLETLPDVPVNVK